MAQGPKFRSQASAQDPALVHLQTERWRNGLIGLVLIAWFSIGGFMLVLSILLASVSPPFLRMIAWMTPTLGLLFLGIVSLAFTFLGAALLGSCLIKITTGRMPLGVRSRRAAPQADRAV